MDTDRRAYPAGCLERLQEVERDLLKTFDGICREQGLSYFADGGTLLGAIRHGGFIPWDDDVDVCMPLEDYERFLQIASSCLPEGYAINTVDNNPEQAILSAKLIKEHTLFYTGELDGSNEREGIFMDIFPLVRLDSSPRKAQRQIKSILGLQRMSYLRHVAQPRVGANTPLRPLVMLGCRAVHATVAQIWTSQQLMEKALRVIHEGDEQGEWTSLPYPSFGQFADAELFPCQDRPFDELTISCPRDIHSYLTKEYGFYMELPPESERYTHLPVALDFGDGVNVMESKQ